MPGKKVKQTDEMIYCGQMNCPHASCLMHKVNTPWGVLVHMVKFDLDKNGNCKDKMEK